jgi:hypothetical protein
MHFSYIGKLAGFSISELEIGSNAMSRADLGAPDNQRDQESTKEGYALTNPDWKTLIAITEKYKEKWGKSAPVQ